jgi:hypothetical protein
MIKLEKLNGPREAKRTEANSHGGASAERESEAEKHKERPK